MAEKLGSPTSLITWGRGGSGHFVTMKAVEQEMLKENPNRHFLELDVWGDQFLNAFYLPFLGRLGDASVDSWNEAMKKGDVKALSLYGSLTFVGEILYFPVMFLGIMKILLSLEEEPERFVTCHPTGTLAFVVAAVAVNFFRGWNLTVELYFCDIPCDKNFFLGALTLLSWTRCLSQRIKIYASEPYLKNGETKEQFWWRHAGRIKVITTDHYVVRQGFRDPDIFRKASRPHLEIPLDFNASFECDTIKAGLSPRARVRFNDKAVHYSFAPQEKLCYVELGSVTHVEGILAAVDAIVEAAKGGNCSDHAAFFIYAGSVSKDNEIYSRLSAKINGMRQRGEIPENISLIPFTKQQDQAQALLMARAEFVYKGLGGSSYAELMELYTKNEEGRLKNKTLLLHSRGLMKEDSLNKGLSLLERVIRAEASREGCDEINLFTLSFAHQLFQLVREHSPEVSEEDINVVLECYRTGNAPSRPASLPLVKKALAKELTLYLESKEPPLSTEEEKTLIERKVIELQKKERYQKYSYEELQKRARTKLLIEKGAFLWEVYHAKTLMKEAGATIGNPHDFRLLLKRNFFAT